IATLCHVPLSGLLTHCWCVEFFEHRVLADYGPPIAAARPLICHGPLYTPLLSCCCHAAGPCHGSLYGLPLLLSPSPHSAMCHFQVSSHTLLVSRVCHGSLYGLPLLCVSIATLCHVPLSGLL
ncbi:unnamed protein product, partial [Staurois parvus]